MKLSVLFAVILGVAHPLHAWADTPVIQSGSFVRVRANNNFGVAKQHEIFPVYGFGSGDSIFDTEPGTTATASCNASYQFTLSGTTATIAIQVQQHFTTGAQETLAEGFIRFSIDEPYEYELSGNLAGAGSDAGDGYQQRTFLRLFQSPFTTVFLEDETAFGTLAALGVNQQNNSGGGLFNQSGPRTGILSPGLYEFMYELEGRDMDLDGAGMTTVTGGVGLVLRRPGTGGPTPPTNFTALTNGLSVAFSWAGSPGATSYQFEAGTAAGLSNAYVADIGNVTSLQAAGPAGTYFARVRAKAGASTSGPSNEVSFTLGASGPCIPPVAPTVLMFAKAGALLTLSWGGSAGATTYRLVAGTGAGLSNAFDGDIGGATNQQFNVSGVPPGVYFVRILAKNACGTSGPSNEVAIPLP